VVRFVHDPGGLDGQDTSMPARDPRVTALTALPNVGPAVARRLIGIGIAAPGDLRGRDPEELFQRMCALAGHREDPCLLDTLRAVVVVADGGPALPWWHYSRLRTGGAAASGP
jgi:hypothetical protein